MTYENHSSKPFLGSLKSLANSLKDMFKSLFDDKEVAFTNAWDYFYDTPDFYLPDGLRLSEVGSARLCRLLDKKVLSYSRNFKGKGGANAM